MNTTKKLTILSGALFFGWLGAQQAGAQTYPGKPVRIITAEAAGGNDFFARVLAQGLDATMGQRFIVENRGGAGGTIAANVVRTAAPDGYTLLFYGSAFYRTPILQNDMRWNPVTDFAPITLATRAPDVLIVNSALPVQSVKDLLALAKARPGQLNYGFTSVNTNGKLFEYMTGAKVVGVSYKGTGPAYVDLISGAIQYMFTNMASATAQVKSGRVRLIAIATMAPSPLLPDVPTVDAAVPGYESGIIYGFFGPVKTSPAIVAQLNKAVVETLRIPGIRKQILDSGAEPVGSTPEEFARVIEKEMAELTWLVKETDMKL